MEGEGMKMNNVGFAISDFGKKNKKMQVNLFSDVSRAVSRWDELKAEWWAWMKENPEVFKIYESTILDMIEVDGLKRISSDHVWHEIRSKVMALNKNQQSESDKSRTQNLNLTKGKFTLNNNYTSLMARYFVKLYPEHASKFELREIKSKNHKAHGSNAESEGRIRIRHENQTRESYGRNRAGIISRGSYTGQMSDDDKCKYPR